VNVQDIEGLMHANANLILIKEIIKPKGITLIDFP
jgi:hypothetical protein